MGIAQLARTAGESILCREGWRRGYSQIIYEARSSPTKSDFYLTLGPPRLAGTLATDGCAYWLLFLVCSFLTRVVESSSMSGLLNVRLYWSPAMARIWHFFPNLAEIRLWQKLHRNRIVLPDLEKCAKVIPIQHSYCKNPRRKSSQFVLFIITDA